MNRLMQFAALLLMTAPFAAFAFVVTGNATTQGDPARPTVAGTTNLPAGTNLIVSILRKDRGYNAQAQCRVSTDGKFTAGPYSEKGKPFSPGTYTIEVLMPLAAGQPSAVQSVIGGHGEKISGPFVHSGPGGLGKIVKYTSQFTIKGANSKADNVKARKKSEADDQAHFEKSCYETIDLANKYVDEGKIQGPKIEGAERQAKIDACLKDMRRK